MPVTCSQYAGASSGTVPPPIMSQAQMNEEMARARDHLMQQQQQQIVREWAAMQLTAQQRNEQFPTDQHHQRIRQYEANLNNDVNRLLNSHMQRLQEKQTIALQQHAAMQAQ